MKKIKEMFKKFVDSLIIKNRTWLEMYYDKIGMGAVGLFILTAFITCFIHAPKAMFTILSLELLLIVCLVQFGDYIDEILD